MPVRLKVLVVTYGSPYPPHSGVAIRDFNLLRQISKSVTLYLCILATANAEPDLSELEQFCEKIRVIPATPRTLPQAFINSARCWSAGYNVANFPFFYPDMVRTIGSIIHEESIDVLQVEHSFLAVYRKAVPADSSCKTILSLHNVASRQYRRIANTQKTLLARSVYAAKSLLLRRMESYAVTQFDRCIVVSDEEGRLLRTLAPTATYSVVENGIDCEAFRPLRQSTTDNSLLFIGVINYPPNADAVLYFCKSILPLIKRAISRVHLMVVGHAPPIEVLSLVSSEGVTVTGFVNDPRPYYERASLCIVPLRAGGGTRLKILEAMALGRPVVTTSIGCEGLDVVDGEHVLIGDTAEDFARHVVRLLRDEELRRRIISAARSLVEERYDWTIAGRTLLRTYQEVVSNT